MLYLLVYHVFGQASWWFLGILDRICLKRRVPEQFLERWLCNFASAGFLHHIYRMLDEHMIAVFYLLISHSLIPWTLTTLGQQWAMWWERHMQAHNNCTNKWHSGNYRDGPDRTTGRLPIDLTLSSPKSDDGGGHWSGRTKKQKYVRQIRSHQNRDGCRRWRNIRGRISEPCLYISVGLLPLHMRGWMSSITLEFEMIIIFSFIWRVF